jgi:hypothetical protein
MRSLPTNGSKNGSRDSRYPPNPTFLNSRIATFHASVKGTEFEVSRSTVYEAVMHFF